MQIIFKRSYHYNIHGPQLVYYLEYQTTWPANLRFGDRSRHLTSNSWFTHQLEICTTNSKFTRQTRHFYSKLKIVQTSSRFNKLTRYLPSSVGICLFQISTFEVQIFYLLLYRTTIIDLGVFANSTLIFGNIITPNTWNFIPNRLNEKKRKKKLKTKIHYN